MLCIFFAIITIYLFLKKRKKKVILKNFLKSFSFIWIFCYLHIKTKPIFFFLNDLLIILYTIGEKVSLQKNSQIFFFVF